MSSFLGFLVPKQDRNRLGRHLSWTSLQAVPVLAVTGTRFPEGVSVVPLNSRMKTLPGGDVPSGFIPVVTYASI